MTIEAQLPEPQAGMVINYEYLWARQNNKGWRRAEKMRPCVILAVVEGNDDKTVYVSPITHTPPFHPEESIELSAQTNLRLGLDRPGNECVRWLMVNEVNKFTWPGSLVRTVPYSEPRTYVYGVLPECVLKLAREKLKEFSAQKALSFVFRAANAPRMQRHHAPRNRWSQSCGR
ncbi:MAG: growth inhibitor PemK [Alphaproteobacteria bacterium]|nr:MAG: growth inhibitor PemK [Alphaproteobacteria bacterium]